MKEYEFSMPKIAAKLADPAGHLPLSVAAAARFHGTAGIYGYWWTGDAAALYSRIKGKPIEKTNATYGDWRILTLPRPALYVGRTGGAGRNRIDFEINFYKRYADDAIYYRQFLNNLGLIYNIPREKNGVNTLGKLIRENVAFSFQPISDPVERFYLECIAIGFFKPLFNQS